MLCHDESWRDESVPRHDVKDSGLPTYWCRSVVRVAGDERPGEFRRIGLVLEDERRVRVVETEGREPSTSKRVRS